MGDYKLPTVTKPLVVKINNPENVQSIIDGLAEILLEMATINANMTPIKNTTKDRWAERVLDAQIFLCKIIPQKET